MKSLTAIGKQVHRSMLASGLTLATAESCTGGWIAKLLTDNSGASSYFKGSAVVYNNAMKRKLLGVAVKDEESAVRPEIAVEMAKRALAVFGSDLAVATTGYMEPPAGLEREYKKRGITGICHVALAYSYNALGESRRGASTRTRHVRLFLKGTRRQNRVSASTAALHLVEKIIQRNRKELLK